MARITKDSKEEFNHQDFRFGQLLNATLNEPGKVPAMVRADPSILEVEDLAGETVLHFLAVEGWNEGIVLLRNLGASIPEYAIYHAIEHGHTDTVALLLELGANPVRAWCERSMENPIWNLSRKQKRLIRSYLDQYGYIE